ncbi:DUF6611 family protein [Mycobacterium sp. SMC-8]|uniref:DUF6611 family protein n=1 Tax=Mycobacterium sp. SMC-8 TaxID=2857060 RepID=UPI0021B20BF4|nr:DUF6611 family protein [Mycobacterium sp. SMC-8]
MNRTGSGRLRRVRDRLLLGDCRWGSLTVRPDRTGMIRYRMAVYPPGITDSERAALRIALGWQVWAPALWLTCQITLTHALGPGQALAVSTALTVSAAVVAMMRVGTQRTRVRAVTVAVRAGYPCPEARQARDRLLALADELMDADRQIQQRLITPAAHESVWWRVYQRLADEAIAASG